MHRFRLIKIYECIQSNHNYTTCYGIHLKDIYLSFTKLGRKWNLSLPVPFFPIQISGSNKCICAQVVTLESQRSTSKKFRTSFLILEISQSSSPCPVHALPCGCCMRDRKSIVIVSGSATTKLMR